MTAVAQLSWCEGALWSESPGCPARAWTRPADLAQARLGTDPAVESLALADGRDLLTAAFAVVPFVCGPLPEPTFGETLTPVARAAYRVFLGLDDASDDFRVMRGEPDDFLVCARRAGAAWQVGGFTVEATTLTVRFEDVWDLTPPELRATSYSVTVLKDGACAIAPDARLFIDLAANGGFLFTFTPEETVR